MKTKIEKELSSFNDVLRRKLKFIMFENKLNIFNKITAPKPYRITNFEMFVEKLKNLPDNAVEKDELVAKIYEVAKMCRFASQNNKRYCDEKKENAVDPIIYDYACTEILQNFIKKSFDKAIGKMTKNFRIILENKYIVKIIEDFGKCTSTDNSKNYSNADMKNDMEK